MGLASLLRETRRFDFRAHCSVTTVPRVPVRSEHVLAYEGQMRQTYNETALVTAGAVTPAKNDACR